MSIYIYIYIVKVAFTVFKSINDCIRRCFDIYMLKKETVIDKPKFRLFILLINNN